MFKKNALNIGLKTALLPGVLVILLLSTLSTHAQFVRTGAILFQDDLSQERIGDFPSRWDLVRGTIEVAHHDGTPVIAFMRSDTQVRPRLEGDGLPSTFSLEMDYLMNHFRQHSYEIRFMDGNGRRSATLYFNGERASLSTRQDSQIAEGNTPFTSATFQPGWRQLALSFEEGHLRLFIDDQRVLNVPRVNAELHSFVIRGGRPTNAQPDTNAFIRNLILAEGGISIYEQVISQGSFTTNDIHFDVNRAEIKPESMPIIRQIFHLLQDHPDLRFSIEGHTDSDGSESLNQQLSQQRSESVMGKLVEMGIAQNRLTAKGWGDSRPIADNSIAEGKAKNRRVEFVVQ